MDGYCSDITRCVFTGRPPAEIAEAYAVLHEAQQAGVRRRQRSARPCEEVDRVGRRIIAAAGYGDYFIHRIGHGIGMEAHEDPYMVEGNSQPARRRQRLQRRTGDLPPRPLGDAPRGHRRRHRRRARGAEHLRPRARRRLSRVSPGCSNCASSGRRGVLGELDRQVGARRGGRAGRRRARSRSTRRRSPGRRRTWPAGRRSSRCSPGSARRAARCRGAAGPPRSPRRSRGSAGRR